MLLTEQRSALAAACRRLAADRFVIGTAGNLSIRHRDLVVITPTGMAFTDADADDMTVVDLTGTVVEGALAPTSELLLHLGVYRSTFAQAIAHAHPLASTAVSCTLTELPALHYTMAALGGPIRVARYATFGSPELAQNVVEALRDRVAALMANHGSVAIGSDLDQACARLEQLDWLAQLHQGVFAAGPARVLTAAELEAVVLVALARNYGTTQPAHP